MHVTSIGYVKWTLQKEKSTLSVITHWPGCTIYAALTQRIVDSLYCGQQLNRAGSRTARRPGREECASVRFEEKVKASKSMLLSQLLWYDPSGQLGLLIWHPQQWQKTVIRLAYVQSRHGENLFKMHTTTCKDLMNILTEIMSGDLRLEISQFSHFPMFPMTVISARIKWIASTSVAKEKSCGFTLKDLKDISCPENVSHKESSTYNKK